jgi:hypothetical protein
MAFLVYDASSRSNTMRYDIFSILIPRSRGYLVRLYGISGHSPAESDDRLTNQPR